jgi:hypothetical protein
VTFYCHFLLPLSTVTRSAGHGFLEDFEVGYVDEYIQRTSFTYLDKPRRVVGLNDYTISQIACGGNFTTALSRDYRIFEWGSWGRRYY